MENANETVLDMDAILDKTMDSVADVPDYITPATGNYILAVAAAELKKGLPAKDGKEATSPRLTITYRIEEVLEVEGSALPPATGSLFTEGFQTTEQGLEYFKKQAKKVLNVDNLDGVSVRDLLSTLPEVAPFTAAVKTTKKGQYENTRINPVHEAA